jgi:DNA-directed RNA polymerase sigma subunit (sigma70/sigma32)
MNESDIGLNRYLREIGRIPLLTPQQEVELAAKVKKGDVKAREQMINESAARCNDCARLRQSRSAAAGSNL